MCLNRCVDLYSACAGRVCLNELHYILFLFLLALINVLEMNCGLRSSRRDPKVVRSWRLGSQDGGLEINPGELHFTGEIPVLEEQGVPVLVLSSLFKQVPMRMNIGLNLDQGVVTRALNEPHITAQHGAKQFVDLQCCQQQSQLNACLWNGLKVITLDSSVISFVNGSPYMRWGMVLMSN